MRIWLWLLFFLLIPTVSGLSAGPGPIPTFPTFFVGATTGSANTYALSAPNPPTGFSLTNQFVVRATISATNTGASTLNVFSTGAKAIEVNASGGLLALKGGELQAALEYDFTYNTTCTCYVVSNLPFGATVAGTTQTVHALQWASATVYVVTTASQTITLDASSTLSANGNISIITVGQSVTLAPNAADSINGGTAGASVTIPAGLYAPVTTDGAGNIRVPNLTLMHLDLVDQSITGGANSSSLSDAAGNITVDCGARPTQYIANTGAFTLTAPANDGACYLDVENGSGAGAITLSGFSPNTMGGATLDTTSGHNFRLYVSRVHGHSTVDAKALQ